MSMMDHPEAGEPLGDTLRAPRSNLFLAASVEIAGAWTPVRIRNLSETGALLEGPAFPLVGAPLVLKRQELEIEGRVVWLRPPRCGIVFDGRISVGEWVAGKRGPVDFDKNRVDAATTLNAASPARFGAPSERIAATSVDVDARIAEELAYLRRIIDAIGDSLADEPIFLQRHSRALQDFDLAGQILGNLANVLKADDRDAAIQAIGMEELRGRLLRKALF